MFEELRKRLENKESAVCVMGVGYTGLPLLVGFSMAGLRATGFDPDSERIGQLSKGIDRTGELEEKVLKECIERHGLAFTSDESVISKADFVIICVPTPITKYKEPDLSFLESAGRIAGRNLKKGGVVFLESTVYPGVTEEVLKPILEKESGMSCGRDFSIGYSPERINPGDREHGLNRVVKVVSGFDDETAGIAEKLYSLIVGAGVFRARNIRTAEAAKVIENVQRDLNIALVNELSIIFRKLGIDTEDVLKAAETKWNFHPYRPGLVGGHCIPVDPYYLVYRSKQNGYSPRVILAGRDINDFMPEYVARQALDAMKAAGMDERCHVILLGLTFKKNVRDTRNAPVKGIISVLKDNGVRVTGHDPLLDKEEIEREFGIGAAASIGDVEGADCLITVTDHDAFSGIGIQDLKGVLRPGAAVVDFRRVFRPDVFRESGFRYIPL